MQINQKTIARHLLFYATSHWAAYLNPVDVAFNLGQLGVLVDLLFYRVSRYSPILIDYDTKAKWAEVSIEGYDKPRFVARLTTSGGDVLCVDSAFFNKTYRRTLRSLGPKALVDWANLLAEKINHNH